MIKTCPVHNVELLKDAVDIRSGFPPSPPKGYFEAMNTLFPHSAMWSMGGCVDMGFSPQRDNVFYCSECRTAERDWFNGRDAEKFWMPK